MPALSNSTGQFADNSVAVQSSRAIPRKDEVHLREIRAFLESLVCVVTWYMFWIWAFKIYCAGPWTCAIY